MMVIYALLLPLMFTMLFAYFAWWSHPRLWFACLCVLATAFALILYLPIRAAFSTPSGSDWLLFGYDFDLFGEFCYVGSLIGLVHLGLFIYLIGSVAEERSRQATK